MKYYVTRQYTRDVETISAEFYHSDDCEFFISVKSSFDESRNLKLIYRIYCNGDIFREYNLEKIDTLVYRAQYAMRDTAIPLNFPGRYTVLYSHLDNEKKIIAKFCNVEDAKLFVESKFTSHSFENTDGDYSIYNNQQLIESINQDSINLREMESKSINEKQNKISFKPTPFATEPRLGPPKWLIEENNDEENKHDDE